MRAPHRHIGLPAFTLIELMVVAAIIVILLRAYPDRPKAR